MTSLAALLMSCTLAGEPVYPDGPALLLYVDCSPPLVIVGEARPEPEPRS